MTDPAPPARSLLDIVLEQTQAGEHNVVVFAMRPDGSGATFAELGDDIRWSGDCDGSDSCPAARHILGCYRSEREK